MVYKLEVGMHLDYLQKTEKGIIKQEFIVQSIPENITDKIVVIDAKTKKRKKWSRDILKYCERHKEEKEKKKSAIKLAIEILERELRPIHITELIELIFKEGYKLPRNGKTFKNTLSTSLNMECAKNNPIIQKVKPAVYSSIMFKCGETYKIEK